MSQLAQQVANIDSACSVRQLALTTPREGPVDLRAVARYHVQGIARADLNGTATVAVSVSSAKRGLLWFARFEKDGALLATKARVSDTLQTALPHPGGMQASGHLLAVACEADGGFARVEIYDVAGKPRLIDTLVLNNGLNEGDQHTRSAAGWLTFVEATPGEYLLLVGGRSFAQREGWFYRYRPQAPRRWEFLGGFAGKPVSSDKNPWGPHSGAAMVHRDGVTEMVAFGSKGPKGKDAYRTRIRCFRIADAPYGLVHQPTQPPAVFTFPGAGLEANLLHRFAPNVRWGSTAFVDGATLLTYFTARNPRPANPPDYEHVLRIAEVRCRP